MKSIIIKMGIAHSVPKSERIGISEPVRKPKAKKGKKISPRKRTNTKRKKQR